MPARKKLRLGLFGGSFNPIHCGHLILAEQAREQLSLDSVFFIPTFQPPHKHPKDLLDAQYRLRLVKLAVAGNRAFTVSNLEIRRGGISYTLDTIEAVRKRHPDAELFLIVGQDMLSVRWRNWDRIKALCTVAVAARPGASPALEPVIIRIDMPEIGISSSDIRERIRQGRSIRYRVPATVESAIRRFGWYL